MCLTAGFKNSVTAGGMDFPVRTDFRVWLSVNKILNSDMEPKEKITSVLGLVYIRLPEKFSDAAKAAMDFFAAGKEAENGKKERLFDFEHDGELILAAFMQQYRINLLKESLHWHEFLALFSALTEDTLFIRVLKIRSTDLSKVKDSSRRRELAALKKAYALPRTVQEEKENEELILSLKRDGGGAR